MPLRPPPGATRPDRVVSPELALVDPVLAVEERARLPERAPWLRIPTRLDSPPDERMALQALASAALDDGLGTSRRLPAARTWPRLATVAVVTILALLLLDVRVDVGRTPATAETTEIPPPVEPTAEPPAIAPKPKPRHRALARSKPVSRRFAWAPVAGADAYRIELFRGAVRVFVATSKSAQLTVPPRWKLGGKRRTLTPGNYRWYVWPVTSGRRAQNAVVQATLTVP